MQLEKKFFACPECGAKYRIYFNGNEYTCIKCQSRFRVPEILEDGAEKKRGKKFYDFNVLQNIVLVCGTGVIVFFLITAPKLYYRYSPSSGHLYLDSPRQSFRPIINYSIVVPKVLVVVLLSSLFVFLLRNVQFRFNFTRQVIEIVMGFVATSILSYAHFVGTGVYFLKTIPYATFIIFIGAFLVVRSFHFKK